jgi:hypothetical protein
MNTRQLAIKSTDLIFAAHRKLGWLLLISALYTIVYFGVVTVVCQHVPRDSAPIEYNGGRFLHELGNVRTLFMVSVLYSIPIWPVFTVITALPFLRRYFNWRSEAAFVGGLVIYCLLFFHPHYNCSGPYHFDATGHYDGYIDWFFEL